MARDRNLRQREYRVNKLLKEIECYLDVSPALKDGEPISMFEDYGGYQIRSEWDLSVVAGEHYSLSLEEVKQYIHDQEVRREWLLYG